MIKLVIIILIEVQANEHAPASSYNSLFLPLSKLSIFDPVRDAFYICMVTRIITCVRNLKVDLPYEYELCITQAFKHCFSNPMYQNLPRYKAVFFFFFWREFQPMASTPDDSSLSSDQDTNAYLTTKEKKMNQA